MAFLSPSDADQRGTIAGAGRDKACDDASVLPPSTTPLILWDIDHTLLTISGVSRDIYAHAFERVTGERPRKIASMAGRTEQAIITDTLTLNDREANETTIAAFYRALGDAALVLRDRMHSQGRALPGGRGAIALLHRAGAVQSLVTGNIEVIARAKLQAFGLTEHLELDTGGYGDHSSDRAHLVTAARERTGARLGIVFVPERTVVVGDTPHDVRGAHHAGSPVIAVATGASTREDLLDAGADAVLSDLGDGSGLVALVERLTSTTGVKEGS